MSRRRASWLTVVLLVVAGASLSADRVRLRSGKVVEGTFIGADSKFVRVLLDDGRVSEIRIEDSAGVEFAARKPPPPPPPPPKPKPKPAAEPEKVMVPAGTKINVRLIEAIDVDVSVAGQTFKASVDDPVMIGGAIVVPRGAFATVQAVAVKQSGTMKGSDKISLKLHSIGFGGMVYEVASGYVESKGKGEGKRTARKVGGGAGLGGLIGGIAGGGEGAAIGAIVGGVTGAAVASGGEEHLKLPSETRLQFELTAAVAVQR
jgi:hypothetical protein